MQSTYATKSELCSQTLRETFQIVVNSLKEGSYSVTAVQKLLINSIGEREYSAQQTYHLLPMLKAYRDFVMLSLDDSRLIENVQDGQIIATLSIKTTMYIAPVHLHSMI